MITLVSIVEKNSKIITLDKALYPNLQDFHFLIIQAKNDYKNFNALPHAIAATPARYVQAAFERITQHFAEDLCLLNPLMTLDTFSYHAFLQQLTLCTPDCPIFFTTKEDITVGIYLPKKFLSTLPIFYFRFLSLTHSSLDFLLLKLLIPQIQLQVLSLPARLNLDNYLDTHLYKYCTMHFINAMHQNSKQLPNQLLAVMPYHAGDVLFFAKAFKETNHPFTHIAVNRCYEDIIKKILPDIPLILISASPPSRGENVDASRIAHRNLEDNYFLHSVYPLIPQNMPYYNFRPAKCLNKPKFHMIDQWKFSLSDHPYTPIEESKPQNLPKLGQKPKSVLIHFDGGWPLKIYPQRYQQELVLLLKNAGYYITILSDKKLALAADNYTHFKSLSQLEKLIKNHALFLGMDSFPANYTTHYLKYPCVVLFSSTHPDNSGAFHYEHYHAIEEKLGCNPCMKTQICPRYQTTYCHNFSSPITVFNTLEAMYQNLYQEKLS